ncbi:MAG: FAD-dependent oxidoreductase [Dehalobacterium sp.]
MFKTGEQIVIEADGAFEYIGLQPTSEAFKSLNILNEYGNVETDTFMATKVAGIYSAGDIEVRRR